MDAQEFRATALAMIAVQMKATRAGRPHASRKRLRMLSTGVLPDVSTLATSQRAPVDAVAESSPHGPKVLQLSDSDLAGLTKDPVHASAVSTPGGPVVLQYADHELRQANSQPGPVSEPAASSQQLTVSKPPAEHHRPDGCDEAVRLAHLDALLAKHDKLPGSENADMTIWPQLHGNHATLEHCLMSREELLAERERLLGSYGECAKPIKHLAHAILWDARGRP